MNDLSYYILYQQRLRFIGFLAEVDESDLVRHDSSSSDSDNKEKKSSSSSSSSLKTKVYWSMRLEGHKPTQFTLGSALRVCSSLGLIQPGEMVHGYVVKNGFESNVFIVVELVDMYEKCKCIFEAEFLFKGLTFDRKNHVLWTSMVTGYAENGDDRKAVEVFCYMRQ
ncbi:hypothetical protein KIW84_063397 [Lathyrus oleraceus]|uniref:Pentatricopeptide repeat-containing protein n=1 Tax=Pisum sativum TaxID=3888 RepID=A0A9D4WBG4_PEA|nr:hypothetical protein KIW84_063397 [Pisum sativum]